jgi:hypothetical protein
MPWTRSSLDARKRVCECDCECECDFGFVCACERDCVWGDSAQSDLKREANTFGYCLGVCETTKREAASHCSGLGCHYTEGR